MVMEIFLKYSYQLYFPRELLWDILNDLPQRCEKENAQPTTIHFPDHDLVLPLRSEWFEDSQHPWDKPIFRFVTSMFFDEDEAIQEYYRNWHYDPTDRCRTNETGARQVAIGFIYLIVYADLSRHFAFSNKVTDMVLFEFSSSSSEMNALFANSGSIRKSFVRLLQTFHGMIGILDQRQKDNHLFWFMGDEVDYTLKGIFFLPEEIAQVLAKGKHDKTQ